MGIKNVASKAGLFLRKHSPEILGAIGVVATVGGVIWACKASVDSADDIRECQADVEQLKDDVEEELIDKKVGRKEIWKARALCMRKVSVRFVGPVVLVSAGLFCQYKSRSILNGRLNSIAAAYTALEARYKLLEDNVRRDYGEEELQRLKYGLRSQKGIVRKRDDVGNEMDVETTVTGPGNLDDVKPFTIIFDSSSDRHKTSSYFCEEELKAMEVSLTRWLKVKGVIWLDWAMDKLDIHPKNEAEAQLWHSICWTYKPGVAGHDNCVKLRWRQVIDPDADQFDIDYNPVYILDPNYDTNMYQKWYQPRKG